MMSFKLSNCPFHRSQGRRVNFSLINFFLLTYIYHTWESHSYWFRGVPNLSNFPKAKYWRPTNGDTLPYAPERQVESHLENQLESQLESQLLVNSKSTIRRSCLCVYMSTNERLLTSFGCNVSSPPLIPLSRFCRFSALLPRISEANMWQKECDQKEWQNHV